MMDFMDSLRRGVDRAGFEVDRLLRTNRVRSRIGSLRSEVDGELREIGRHVMELYERSEAVPAGLRERCERVKQLRTEIADREAELEAINKETPREAEQGPTGGPAPSGASCPKCGHAVPEWAHFCPNCGASVEAPPSPGEPPTPTEPPPPAG